MCDGSRRRPGARRGWQLGTYPEAAVERPRCCCVKVNVKKAFFKSKQTDRLFCMLPWLCCLWPVRAELLIVILMCHVKGGPSVRAQERALLDVVDMLYST